jgi:hypothetical protein
MAGLFLALLFKKLKSNYMSSKFRTIKAGSPINWPHANERKQEISSLPIHERIKRFKMEVKEPIIRPKAVYDNKSREQYIEEILSL